MVAPFRIVGLLSSLQCFKSVMALRLVFDPGVDIDLVWFVCRLYARLVSTVSDELLKGFLHNLCCLLLVMLS